jgi:hypothetical protein
MDLPEMIDGSPYALLDDFKVGKELIPKMLGKARKIATATAKKNSKRSQSIHDGYHATRTRPSHRSPKGE